MSDLTAWFLALSPLPMFAVGYVGLLAAIWIMVKVPGLIIVGLYDLFAWFLDAFGPVKPSNVVPFERRRRVS